MVRGAGLGALEENMSRVVVLMYHALYANDRERTAIDVADRPYAVSLEAFERQLDAFSKAGLRVIDPAALLDERGPQAVDDDAGDGVVLTFDDGHVSNRLHALPALARRNARAAFFVTRDFIGRRAGFCSASDLRALADAGMTVGAHGCTHRFFDDLNDAQAADELREAKSTLEDITGRGVTQMSFPGGRWTARDVALGDALGYRLFHTSRVGAHRLHAMTAGATVSRIAIRDATSVERAVAIARASPAVLLPAQVTAAAKALARHAMGNRLYQRLYERAAH